MELDTFYYGEHFCGHKTLQEGKETPRSKVHERDPVILFRSRLTTSGICSEEELQVKREQCLINNEVCDYTIISHVGFVVSCVTINLTKAEIAYNSSGSD